MRSVSAKELHNETSKVLSEVEQGQSLVITRNGRIIARLGPAEEAEKPRWGDIMAEVWEAQKRVQPHEIQPNPVLAERARRRR
jgi:prevent-host-death family protein